MAEALPDPAPADLRLAEALEDYCRQLEQGLDPGPEGFLAARPELEGLAECLHGLAAIEELRGALECFGPMPRHFGEYELVREIGRGGMGVVYEARQFLGGEGPRAHRTVALKMILAGQLATPTDVQRFRAEAESAAQLDHPNIVPIYQVGEVEDGAGHRLPYFTMKLVEGGSLAQRLAEVRLPRLDRKTGKDELGRAWSRAELAQRRRALARLIATVARAVHHAHERGILHRDLKPANILLHEEAGSRLGAREKPDNPSFVASGAVLPEPFSPHLTDFGLAKRFEGGAGLTRSGAIVGTPEYVAPEQAAGQRGLTTAADVYSLGAILYELLTGRPPFSGETAFEVLRQVLEREPQPPRALNPGAVDRDVETIALKCLAKAPERRYASAAALADDLERWSEGEPIRARRASSVERSWRWCLRHPGRAFFAATATLLLLALAAATISLARSRAARLEEEALQSNVYAARGVASTVLWQLEHLSGPVVQTAESAELRRLLEKNDRKGLQAFFDRLHQQHQQRAGDGGSEVDDSPYQSWHLLGPDGRLLADSVHGRSGVLGENFSGRDYFQGALARRNQRGRASVHVSRVYLSRNDGMYKFAITAPIHARAGPDSPLLGVLAATLTTASTLGPLRLDDERRTAVLVGRRDPSPPGGPPRRGEPAEYVILLHPAYQRGVEPRQVPGERLRAIHQPRPGSIFRLPASVRGADTAPAEDAHYRDPLATEEGGRWLAGFAPVGNTELAVIVQQRHDAVLGPDRRLVKGLLLWGGGLLLAGALMSAGAWALRRSRHAHDGQPAR